MLRKAIVINTQERIEVEYSTFNDYMPWVDITTGRLYQDDELSFEDEKLVSETIDLTKIFDLEVPKGNTSCNDCPFIQNRNCCLYLSETKLCSQYDFTKIKLKESMKRNVRFGGDVTNEQMIALLLQFPSDARIAIECCNPRTMRYNKEDNSIRID